MRSLMLITTLALALTACAESTGSLQRLTARAVIPTPYPDSVIITDQKHDALGNMRSWVATTRRGVYDCSLEAGERVPLCAKRDSIR